MEAAPHPWPALGVLLLRDGVVDRDTLEAVLREQRDTRHQRISGWRLGEILVERGIVTQADVARFIAEQYELPFLELQEADIDLDTTRALSEELCNRLSALPIRTLADGSVVIAVADPGVVLFSEELRRELAAPLRFEVVTQDAMYAAMAFVRQGATAAPSAGDEPHAHTAPSALQAHPAIHVSPLLGTLLIRDGLVSEGELEAALTQQRLTASKRLGEILVERGTVSRTDVARVVARQYELPFLDLVETEIDPQAASLLPVDLARRYKAIPTGFRADGSLRVAVADPTNVVHSDEILLTLGVPVSFAVAAPDAIDAAIELHYGGLDTPTPEAATENGTSDPPESTASAAETDRAIDEILMEATDFAESFAGDDLLDGLEAEEVVAPSVPTDALETLGAPTGKVDDDDPSGVFEASELSDSFTQVAHEGETSSVGDEATDFDAETPVPGEGGDKPATTDAVTTDLSAGSDTYETPPSAIDAALDMTAPERIAEIREASSVRETEGSSSIAVADDLEQFIEHARSLGASSVHFSPQHGGVVVRVRVDGAMRELGVIAGSAEADITRRLGALCALDAYQDLRIAVLPTTLGEKVTLRVLNQTAARGSLSELGLAPDDEQKLRAAIHQPFGAVLVCGPTGSGKTTTLYAALRELNSPERTLTTIEDPVEYVTPGVDQTEVNPPAGLTFARGLSMVLRSDPDVILVGEIGDAETARIAVRAAMTGHLVLSTLHAQTAASAIQRLRDMGIESGRIGETLTCLVAQRLARSVCLDCRETYYATADELVDLERTEEQPGTRLLARGRGCPACGGTGYRGRVGLFEVFLLTDEIRELVASGAPTTVIHRTAVEAGMRTLRVDGIRLCLEGVTTAAEVRRVVGDRG
jgi:type IV pilus assembly protein PilB